MKLSEFKEQQEKELVKRLKKNKVLQIFKNDYIIKAKRKHILVDDKGVVSIEVLIENKNFFKRIRAIELCNNSDETKNMLNRIIFSTKEKLYKACAYRNNGVIGNYIFTLKEKENK